MAKDHPNDIEGAARKSAAYMALTDRQRAFVVAIVGGQSKTSAAKAAGYSSHPLNLKTTGYSLGMNPRVQSAILEVAGMVLAASVPLAVNTLDWLARNAEDPLVRVAAAKAILDRIPRQLPQTQPLELSHD